MNSAHFIFIGLLGAGLLSAGCRSHGPEFDARTPVSNEQRDALSHVRPAGPVELDESAFASIHSTNELQREWLNPPSDFFTLGPGDAIEIEILGEAGSTATALVGPDGKIYYGLLPGLYVWGLTLPQARELLVQELGRFLKAKPVVALTLKAVASKRVWIMGRVHTPGVYSLASPMTVLEALAAAGGTASPTAARTELPDLRNSFLMRNGKSLKIDFHRLLSQGDMSQNIYLQPDDFLYLKSATVRSVYVLGAVLNPNIIPYTDDLSLVAAITSAGGTVEYAQVGQVAIVRGSLSEPKIAFVDFKAITRGQLPDVKLEEGDIVYVPFVFYRKAAIFAEMILDQFVRTVAANAGLRAAGGERITGSISVSGGYN